MTRLHLGVDYGTSASKLVLRNFEAPGGTKAYLLEYGGEFRYSSAISFDKDHIVFNVDENDKNAYKSLKMRFAEEVTGKIGTHFYGELVPISYNLSACDLVTLTIWRLISIGHLEAFHILEDDSFNMGMTLGIPMSFLDHPVLRNAFLEVARVAYYLYRTYGPIGHDRVEIDLAKDILVTARTVVKGRPQITGDNIRNWIRSETEASMFWSFYSPSIPQGPYFCIDIGAGTTDANVFLINDRIIQDMNSQNIWKKDELVFFGAHSVPHAMDLLSTLDPEEMKNGFGKIRQSLIKAGQNAYGQIKDNVHAVKQWRDSQLIILGGGSLNSKLCQHLLDHPMTNWRGITLQATEISVPDDLVRINESPVLSKDVVFTSVAYGLAELGLAVPKAARPTEVQPVVRMSVRSLPNHESMYDE